MEFSRIAVEFFGNGNQKQMKDQNDIVFIRLFKEVCQKCFGRSLSEPLTETESKHLSSAIFEKTGLVIGVKSIRNYSIYVHNPGVAKKENPSVATLDTLSRYLLNAPETDELNRKKYEGHFPWWFEYRSKHADTKLPEQPVPVKKSKARYFILAGVMVLLILVAWQLMKISKEPYLFSEDFTSVDADSLQNKGWILQRKAQPFWNNRNGQEGHLSLFTLVGDNWNDLNRSQPAGIKNLLLRKIDVQCFSTEIHLSGFIPDQNWQQAGIILSEDSSFTGRTIRYSIGYNDFFGGYSKPPEIIIQAVGSTVTGTLSRPEEIGKLSVFAGDVQTDNLIRNNLLKSALKIEKRNNQYRFLFSAGPVESFAFKEAFSSSLSIQPKWIAIFAMQGFAEKESPKQVLFDSFSAIEMQCQ